ncbi:MAG: DUF3891 family protein [Alphaproteobacteria bacterium]
MIVQSAPDGQPHFLITMAQHTRFAGALAEVFGNERFEKISPKAEMEFVIAHHDAGWAAYDAAPGLDRETGLPYNLTRTPLDDILKTSSASPDFNEAYHPYAGLISSMHSWGLYNGRYGLSDKVLMENFSEDQKKRIAPMLDHEVGRQARLEKDLASDPDVRAWISTDKKMQNYKQLQFFDTFSLYFHMTHAANRKAMRIEHVPLTAVEDVSVTVTPVADGYVLDPFPFAEDRIEVPFEGRYLAAGECETEAALHRRLADQAVDSQSVTLLAPR